MVSNPSIDTSPMHVLPTLWFRNTWAWGYDHDGANLRPELRMAETHAAQNGSQTLPLIHASHATLGEYRPRRRGQPPDGLDGINGEVARTDRGQVDHFTLSIPAMSGARTEKMREQVHLNPQRPLVMYGKQIASASYD